MRRAASPNSPVAALCQLARDPELIVRAAVAINGACGPEVDAILIRDEDERVRALLGDRVTRLLPRLALEDRNDAAEHVQAMLAALVRDHATKVRATIADAIKTMPRAPHDLVLALAQDEVGTVSDPVIRLSPVLTDADLLGLLATPPHAAAARSIASRPGLSARVSQAIADHADAPAIRTLLANQSACIQEATLDALVGRAPYHVDWHAPLINRPQLSAKAVRALTQFVATDLLAALANRTHLDPDVLDGLRAAVAADPRLLGLPRDDAELLTSLRQLQNDGELTESVLLSAVAAGDFRRAAACLAIASDVPLAAVDRVINLNSPKALVSFVWKAGFSMRVASVVQASMAQLPSESILHPTADGGFPLSEREMDWHIELHAEPSLGSTRVSHLQPNKQLMNAS